MKCILNLLRGRYLKPRQIRTWPSFSSKRRTEEISYYTHNNLVLVKNRPYMFSRLEKIILTLFKRPPMPKLHEYIDKCVEILTQIAAHRFIIFQTTL